MRVFLDTSVLVAAVIAEHVHHPPSNALFASIEGEDGTTGLHSLAELYSSLTGLPASHRLDPQSALAAIAEVRQRLAITALDATDYFEVLDSAARLGVMGSTIHDALIARCAIKAKADVIYTWNLRHFQMLGPEIAALVRTPSFP